MMNLYDHRFATYEGATGAAIPAVTDEQHDDPTYEPLPRYWVAEEEVTKALGDDGANEFLFGWRWIARSTDARTFITTSLPIGGTGNSYVVVRSHSSSLWMLKSVWSSLCSDFIARQKLSGSNMAFFLVNQFACPPPSVLNEIPAWLACSLASWLEPRVLELSFTSQSMAGLVNQTTDAGAPFQWLPDRRQRIMAEIDAAMFHLFGLARDEVDHVLGTFTVMNKYDQAEHGELRTARAVLDFYDRMADAAETGVPYQTPIDPMPGSGPRHKEGVTS